MPRPKDSRPFQAGLVALRSAALPSLCLALAGGWSPAAAQAPHSLQFNGSSDYVTFGAAPSLGAATFTIEVRFKRTGAGVGTSTGVGGFDDAVPLITKGRGEVDGDNRDCNYFLGIRSSDNVLCADFEEGTGQTSPGLNHPVAGVTPITNNVWHHGAATFDGTAWRLYLDGNLEATLVVGSNRLPQSASIQHAGLATALNSSGTPGGFFQGLLDEGRIWNVARSQSQIQAAMGGEVLSGSGLLGRWGLNEGAGASAGDAVPNGPNGTLAGGPVWSSDSTVPLSTATALRLGGTNGYVTFGDAVALHLSHFTLETWFRRDGAGVSTSTGTGGISNVIPLIAKGRSEGESSTLDLNYVLGIRASDNVLVADLEEGSGGTTPSLNHPIAGVTAISNGIWYHAAVTYDGSKWQLFLNGALEAQLVVGQPVASTSIQHASLGTALNSTGVAAGFFSGALDEARIWNVARTQTQIQASMNSEVASASGLVARWGMNEDAGVTIASSAGTTITGSILGSDWSWAAGSPFNAAPPAAPAAPTGFSASAFSLGQINLAWTDVANNETGYEVERSTTGSGGPFVLLTTRPSNSTSYVDTDVLPASQYCYRVRAVNGAGASAYAGPACATALGSVNHALASEYDAYVAVPDNAALHLNTFTIELWLRRDTEGLTTTSGQGGIADIVPMVAKGRAEGDAPTVDINYILGFRQSNEVLCADFEEGAGGASPGANHPLFGATPLQIGVWHHAAFTYDGTTERLYLDGTLEASQAVGEPPASASISPLAILSALSSVGAPEGNFVGVVDEVRIWNVARSQSQIRSTANNRIETAQSGLIARWGLDEGSGTTVNGTAGTTLNGTISGTYYRWIDGGPFNLTFDKSPAEPALNGPADRAFGVPTPPSLSVAVSDPEGSPVTVTWYGRVANPSPAPDFTLVGLPDTQYYTSEQLGGTNAMLRSQTDWVVANRVARNIAYTVQLGDCVEHGDNNGNPIEWMRADTAYTALEDPITTSLVDGVPYGICVGNHDQSPIGDPEGSTTFFNQYFGVARFQGRAYYGGHYGGSNDNHYQLFSASGMDFIVICPAWDTSPNADVLAWMDGLLTTYANRRAIIACHYIANTGNPATFSGQGQAIWNALRGHSNLFLMLSAHIDGEGRRQDTFSGHTVYSLESNYQWHNNGGNGRLRIMEFSPANNQIRVRTYSPWSDEYDITPDSLSQFTIGYDMSSGPAFQVLGTASNVPSGSNIALPWNGLPSGSAFEWYATVSDGTSLTRGPFWRFTTSGPLAVGDERVTALALSPVAPNPMVDRGRIAFAVPEQSPVRLGVYDVQGREVARLASGVHAPGRYSVHWDGRGSGGRLQSGVYFVRLETPGRTLVQRLVLLH